MFSTHHCWFRKTPMGINKRYGIMAEMKSDAGITDPESHHTGIFTISGFLY